jgi:hypothetical protein
VALHIEDELTSAAESRLRQLRFESGFSLELEKAAALSNGGASGVEGKQRARRAASRDQKVTPANTQALGILACRLMRQPVGGAVYRQERNRRELPLEVVSSLIGSRRPSGSIVCFIVWNIDQRVKKNNPAPQNRAN